MLLEGSLNMSMRGGSEHWQPTDKVDGGPRHGTMKWVLWCEEIRTYIRHLGCILLVPRYKLMCRKNL